MFHKYGSFNFFIYMFKHFIKYYLTLIYYTELGFKHVCQQNNSYYYSCFEQNAFSIVVIIIIVLIILIHSFFI